MEPSRHDIPESLPYRKRPFSLTLLCLFSWVYFFILSILFAAGFFYSGRVTDAINLYAPAGIYRGFPVKLTLGLFTFFFSLAFTGITIMWKMRRAGYYLFGISALVLAALQLFRPDISFSGILILLVMLVLFGLFFRRFR